jgi:hypothetical protein
LWTSPTPMKRRSGCPEPDSRRSQSDDLDFSTTLSVLRTRSLDHGQGEDQEAVEDRSRMASRMC